MPLFLIFLILPLAEFYCFAMVGARIGFITAICLIFLAFFIGAALIKAQGMRNVLNLQRSMKPGQMPLNSLFDSLCQIAAGLLFMTPGFLTDILGVLLLIPSARNIMRGWIHKNTAWEMHGTYKEFRAQRPYDPDIIEGEYERLDPDNDQKNKGKTYEDRFIDRR